MTVVPIEQAYVDANFKEVQLDKVRIGQPAIVTSDYWGAGVKFHGTVVGLAGGTGAAFSLIPAQNATGNWIKVVQRLPVRIALDPDELRRPSVAGRPVDERRHRRQPRTDARGRAPPCPTLRKPDSPTRTTSCR